MKIRASRTYSTYSNNYFISKEYECSVIPVKRMCFTDLGLTENGVIQPVEINEVTIDPASNSYHILLAKDSHEYTKEELKRKFEEMKANGWEYIEDLLV
ncbi:hypothetical protein OHV96_04790 [Acinetobacter baumannii]|nr:hypothetical protein [Acinetobacter baumannii]